LSTLERNKKAKSFFFCGIIFIAVAIILIFGSSFPNTQAILSLQNNGQASYASIVALPSPHYDSSKASTSNDIHNQYLISASHVYSVQTFNSSSGSKNIVGNTVSSSSSKVVMINFDDGRKSQLIYAHSR
jgi:hypothetical protein